MPIRSRAEADAVDSRLPHATYGGFHQPAGSRAGGGARMLPVFPASRNEPVSATFTVRGKHGVAEMGAGDQVASMSVVAFFSLALIVISNQFVQSRATKNLAMPAAATVAAPSSAGNSPHPVSEPAAIVWFEKAAG
ncbi:MULTISPECIES: hypothetical protein [Bradyrhizobium]|uniref:Uncharacterized protein n=1 Tax=Bradyrhizobium brasilense TaxID=1419277 RepID=A0ABY8J6N2_9BRAD|nr:MULTISPECIES: hypothetical protein [Bradyrhizobium]MCP1907872.1 hypothetical protein [Bradyrhizobium elkanii]MCP1834008.1 hypothetical protein [Bradyrhizobium sp. USDA 4545]MCP1853037.1 hypothetical protein [Bradyrhizobium sp. USDA 4541]MCP1918754.1 hypothetical protein [Bradyrhizobium sp. USDA 4532]WFU61205.1 hypothetical protein QA636_27210 [Bradyrhizobium brasilense]